MNKNSENAIEEAFEEIENALEEELEKSLENIEEEEMEEEIEEKPKEVVRMSTVQKDLEMLYTEFEETKTEARQKQERARKLKEEIINIMNMLGRDEVIINGLDSVVQISITYHEVEVLNKKTLAEELGMKQKELFKPQTIVELTNMGKLTTEMIEKHTETDERMQFSVKDYNPNEEDD